MKYAICFALIAGLVFSACKKPPVDPPVEEDVEMRRISSHLWEAYKLELGGIDVWNYPGGLKDCQRDDSYRFNRDGSLIEYENAKVCTAGTDSFVNTWKFYDGRKQVIATVLGITDTAGIKLLDDTDMQLSMEYEGSPAVIYFRKK